MRARLLTAVPFAALFTAASAGVPALAQGNAPYFGSIAAGQARMRVGPGREYPASWLYQRADLPVRVLETYKGWKKVEDPDGTTGWMQANLLSASRTALVRDEVVELRAEPRPAGRVLWRAAPGVVGRISQCGNGWCRLDVRGRAGFVEVARLWGVTRDETVN